MYIIRRTRQFKAAGKPEFETVENSVNTIESAIEQLHYYINSCNYVSVIVERRGDSNTNNNGLVASYHNYNNLLKA